MKFRLKSAHYFPGDKWLPGDVEMADRGENAGTIVGDGTPYGVGPGTGMSPTIEMEPLDDEAREALEAEQARIGAATLDPVEQLPLTMDSHEQRYVPGFNVRRK